MDLTLNRFLETRYCSFAYRGPEDKLNHRISGVSIDSRTIRPNEIYFALWGENHDGHKFVRSAFDNKAKAAVVEGKWWKENKSTFQDYPILIVDDSLKALQESACEYRKKFNIPVIGLTGTNGKTTTKEMVAAVLSETSKVCKNEGNLNNHIGVPLTIFQAEGQPQNSGSGNGHEPPGRNCAALRDCAAGFWFNYKHWTRAS